MAKYRKKPVVVDALQLRWDNWSEMCDFIGKENFVKGFCGCFIDWEGNATDDASFSTMGLKIPTLEGEMLGRQDDFIIKGINGEFYPCKPDIFEKTYESVIE